MPRRPPAGLDPGAARPCCPSRRRLCVDPADAPFALHPPLCPLCGPRKWVRPELAALLCLPGSFNPIIW